MLSPFAATTTTLHRAIVGTAGHIDHGKTNLVKALTGIDCDRWTEEKRRGITIDLGFAHFTEGDLQVGFVDVPGHERFVHNALAGLGGIRIMLLVVAADEGVMPQTREHLAICSLLGIPKGVIALTKTDLVSPDLLDLAELEILELLERTPFSASKIIRVSSLTGQGLDVLKESLLALVAEVETPVDTSAPFRLPIDRAFHLRGLGVVVTGTLASGVVHVGDVLEMLPTGQSARVRSIQVHGTPRDQAVAGERTSLQLTGLSLDDLERGFQLVTPGSLEPSVRLCARFTLLETSPEPLRHNFPGRLHLYSTEALGTIRPLNPRELKPGESGLVEILLQSRVMAIRGDRFIVRRPSPQTTLGGGQILDPLWRRRRGSALALALESLCVGDWDALLYWIQAEGERGVEAEVLARRLGVKPEGLSEPLAALVRKGQILLTPDTPGRARRWLAATAYERVAERAKRVLQEYFLKDSMARGIPKAEAVKRIMPATPAHLTQAYLSWLQDQKILGVEGDLVVLPGRRVELSALQASMADAILRRFEESGLAPPSLDQIRSELPGEAGSFQATLRYLLQIGRLLRLPNGTLIASSAVKDLRTELLSTGWDRFSVPRFKDRFGLTRKFAIPLLEYFDSIGTTRRIGEERMLVGSPG